MSVKMACLCRLCELRTKRDLYDPLSLKRHSFQRQSTLPSDMKLQENDDDGGGSDEPPGNEDDDVIAQLPPWGQILAHQKRNNCSPSSTPRHHSPLCSPSQPRKNIHGYIIPEIEFSSQNEEPPPDIRRMTVSDPMYIRKKRGCHQFSNNNTKRNSWDMNSSAEHVPSLQAALSSSKLSLTTGPISSSVGDMVQITKSPPTPKDSPSSSTSDVVGSSGYTSIGDISIKSAPTPPITGFNSKQSTPSSSNECSPEIRRKLWHTKILTIKDDLEKVCHRVKHAKDSLDTWRAKKADLRKSISCSDDRTIKVEYIEMKKPNHHWSFSKYRQSKKDGGSSNSVADDGEEYDVPDHNISPALILTSLQDCMFTAEVSMDNIPSGDITLRISGYRVEIIIDKRKTTKNIDNSHRVLKPFKYGEIDIPIYVDPSSLCFHYENTANTLRLQAKMKGTDPKKCSLSNDDLRLKQNLHSKNRRVTSSSGGKSQGSLAEENHLLNTPPHTDAISDCGSNDSLSSENSDILHKLPIPLKKGQLSSIGEFRDRAYTK